MELNGIGVEALDPQHGAEIIETFKALGVDTCGYTGGARFAKFYGVKNGWFRNRNRNEYSKIITLEELKSYLPSSYNFKAYPKPKMMEVWDDIDFGIKNIGRPVFAEQVIDGHTWYWAFEGCSSIDEIDEINEINETESANRWKHAREIQPVVTITMDEALKILEKEKGCKVVIS